MENPPGADNIVRLAEARNPQEAHVWRQVLEENGIECRVVGDILEAGIGDLPKVGPEVWVHKADQERAKQILADTQRPRSEEEDESEEV